MRLFWLPITLFAMSAATAQTPAKPPVQKTNQATTGAKPIAPSYLGNWKGTISIVPGRTPDGKSLEWGGEVPKLIYKLNLRSNGSYLISVTGTPDKIAHTTEGKWKPGKGTLILSIDKRDGKPDKTEPRQRILELAKDGKSMTTNMQGQVRLNNAKGEAEAPPKGFVAPSILIVFKR